MRYETDFEGHKIVIVGTGHVFNKSIQEIEGVILREHPEVVCVELDKYRYLALQKKEKATFLELLKYKGFRFAVISGLLSFIQNEIGEEYGVMPGSDMLTAIDFARKEGSEVYFIDRDVGMTIDNLIKQMTIKEKIKTLFGAILSLTPLRREVSVTQFDQSFINEILRDFKKFTPNAYNVLIDERNAYMFLKVLKILRNQLDHVTIVIVIGAGHLQGIASMIEAEKNDKQRKKKRNNQQA